MNKLREPDIIFKWTNCCRLCLSQESTIDLFSEASISQHFPSKIRSCLNFLIYSGDPMPRKICSECCIKLDSWYQFRKECIQTERDLKRRLEPYKKIAFVKEYFDKYIKYKKSNEDGSISPESMSEYDENEDEDDDVDGNSDYMQREDENSELSDSEKGITQTDCHNIERKQNCPRNTKLCDNQYLKDSSNNAGICGTEKEFNNENKGTSYFQKIIKNKGPEKEKCINESVKKLCSTKDDKKSSQFVTSIIRNVDIENLNSYKAGERSAKFKGILSDGIGRNSTDENNGSLGDISNKACPDCGVDFPSEEQYAVHSCIAAESGAESDDNDNFINPLSFVDTSLSEPAKETPEGDCSFSDFTSDSFYKPDEDIEKKAQVTVWKCLACNGSFKSIGELQEHYDSSDNSCSQKDVFVECEICNHKFPTKNELLEHHQAVHMDTNVNVKTSDLVKCTQCELDFESERELEQHSCAHQEGESLNEGEDGLFCSKCEQTFFDRELFEKHELIHNQQDIYNSIVTPQFTTFEGIEGVEDLTEQNEQLEEESKKPQNVVRCFRCGRLFGSSEELKQHEFLKHKNPTPYFCRKCDLRFSARSQLLMHVRSHMRKSNASTLSNSGGNTSDNTCSICNAKFFLPSDLQSHIRMHKYSPTEEPPAPAAQKSWQSPDPYGDNKIDLFARFKCSVCSKIFVHSGSIIRHGKNLHKGQAVYPLRLKRPIFLMKRAKSLSLPAEKNFKTPQTSKQINANNVVSFNMNMHSQQQQQQPEENYDMETSQEARWEQDSEGMKTDPNLEFGTEKCPFCEKVFKPTYLPRHIKRNHRGEVLDPQMLGREIPDDSLVCRYCLKSCSNPHNRRVHESIHYPVKMQCTQCKICGQKFFNKASYEVHILSCKSVRCGKCNKIFFRYMSLKNHSCTVTVPAENKV